MLFVCSGLAGDASAETTNWLTGRDLDQRLDRSVSVTFSGRELRNGLSSLATQQKVAIWIDRRVDPHQKIDLAIRDLPLGETIQELARHVDLSSTRLGPVIYVGPITTAEKLATVVQRQRAQIKNLPGPRRKVLLARRPLAWHERATPQQVLAQIGDGFQIAAIDVDKLPHDLWPANSLPPLDLAEQLTLVTAGFDRAFRINRKGTKWRLEPMPEDISDAAKKKTPAASQRSPASRQQDKDTDETIPDRKRITLRVEDVRLRTLLRSVEQQLSLSIDFDERLQADESTLNQRVSVDATDATIDEFVAAVLQDTGLSHRREGRKIRISPAK